MTSLPFTPSQTRAYAAGRLGLFVVVVKMPKWAKGREIVMDDFESGGKVACAFDYRQETLAFLPCPFAKIGFDYSTGKGVPFYRPGERIGVKERWACSISYDYLPSSKLTIHSASPLQYESGGGFQEGKFVDRTCFDVDGELGRWRSARSMPEWAIRFRPLVSRVECRKISDLGKDGRKAELIKMNGVTDQDIEHQAKWFHADDSPMLAWFNLNPKFTQENLSDFAWFVWLEKGEKA